jgi:antitoxin HigA-1
MRECAMMAARPALRRQPKPGLGARRNPVHPGHFLETRFLTPLGITQVALAAALGVSRRRVNELVRGRRGISHDTALKLAEHFGTEPEFWLQLQLSWDMHRVMKNRPRG